MRCSYLYNDDYYIFMDYSNVVVYSNLKGLVNVICLFPLNEYHSEGFSLFFSF